MVYHKCYTYEKKESNRVMPAKNPRLNIVLEKEVFEALDNISKKRGISRSLLARDLIKEALEIQEDIYWAQVATERDKSLSEDQQPLSHDDVWD